jgi:uncharacterized delta-60 repeat protein
MRKIYLYIIIQLLFIVNIHAQSGDLDLTFGNPVLSLKDSSRFNGRVSKIIVQPDGNLLIAGDFDKYNTDTFPNIIRLLHDDLPDTSFHPGVFDDYINNMVLQPDSKIVVCGKFNMHDNDTSSGIIRLNPDGSLDAGFALNNSLNLNGYGLALQTDGKIILGGNFSLYRGDSAKCLVRLNSDGTIDTAFMNNLGSGFDSWVQTIIIQPDGKIVVGGRFTECNGTPCDRIVRLNGDGTVDLAFLSFPAFDNNVLTLCLQPDGKILVGGMFELYDSTTQRRLMRLNTDGTRDTTFNIGKGFNDIVFELGLQPNGEILVGGRFWLFDSTYKNECIIRLDSNGSYESSFYPGAECSNTVLSLALESNGNILVGGDFISVNNTKRNHIARLFTAGVLHGTFGCEYGFESIVSETFIQPDGKILVSGPFIRYDGYLVTNFIRLMSDGSIDTSCHTKLGFGFATEIAMDNTGNKVYLAGNFTACNSKSRRCLARIFLNGDLDTLFVVGDGFNAGVKAIAVQTDGKIIVGGAFTTYDSTLSSRIIRLNTDGSIDTTFNIGTGFNDEVKDIVIQPDGKIVVCGVFTAYNSTASNRIIRLESSGMVDTAFHPMLGFNDNVISLALQTDGKIIAGGLFTQYNNTLSGRIVRINADGSFDLTFNASQGFSNGSVNEIVIQPDGQIIAAGEFNSYQNQFSKSIARLNANGSYDYSFAAGVGFNNKLRSISIQTDGRIICGGEYTMYQSYHINYLCRLESFLPVAVNELNETGNLSVYPNPSSGTINIDLDENFSLPAEMQLTDLIGQEIENVKLVNRHNMLNIDHAPGIYLVKISNGKDTVTRKIIIR